jgi:hypothetical protein
LGIKFKGKINISFDKTVGAPKGADFAKKNGRSSGEASKIPGKHLRISHGYGICNAWMEV